MLVGAVALAVVIVLAAAGLIYQHAGERRDRLRHPAPGRLVDAGGVRLHVCAAGEALPGVVFLSGIATSSLNWTALQRRLSPQRAVCAYDRAGLGWSELGPRRFSVVEHVAQLRTSLEAVGFEPPYLLVAHSYGAYIAQVLADLHEDEVAGIVFLDPITWADWVEPGAADLRRLRGGALFARIGAALAALGVVRFVLGRFRHGRETPGRFVLSSFGPVAVAAVTRIFGQVGKLPPETWDAIQAHWSRPRAFLAMARHFEGLPADAQTVRELEHARSRAWAMPVVVLGARDATPAQKQRQRALAARSTSGRYCEAAAGHWVHLDDPLEVIEVINHVVSEAAGRRQTEDP